MKDAMQLETEQERDRLKALIEKASQTWLGELPGSAGRDGYIASIKAALEDVEEALRIINNA